tara:strand:- start:193 stop:387 length:195 start_codon:yes stop_codon:yes gene_type:complete
MTLLEVNENHLQSLLDIEDPNYDFGFFNTWMSILIRVLVWILPGSIILFIGLSWIYNNLIVYIV